jgi:dolichol-phosphate mannosyltransferase
MREPIDATSVLVVIPTYNEAASLAGVVAGVRTALPDAHVLVVDDNSPDGTGELADRLAAGDDHLRVLHRSAKKGLGAAYLAGFRWGLSRRYQALVEMDADGSHQPQRLPAILDALDDADAVIGSRWVDGGGVANWPRHRQWLSRGGNGYVHLMLGLGVRDATAGFRAYRASALAAIDLDTVSSQGYCFQVDLTRRMVRAGLQVVEVPITFVERETGQSKMNGAIVAEALARVTAWGIGDRARDLILSRRG